MTAAAQGAEFASKVTAAMQGGSWDDVNEALDVVLRKASSYSKFNRIEFYHSFPVTLGLQCLTPGHDEELAERACDLVDGILDSQPNAVGEFLPHVLVGLQHQQTLVRKWTLNRLAKICSDASVAENLIERVGGVAWLCLADEDLGVSMAASRLIVLFFQLTAQAQRLFEAPQFPQITQSNSTVRLRILDLALSIINNVPATADAVRRAGVLALLRPEYESGDSLVRLNVVELLSALASTSLGVAEARDAVEAVLTDLFRPDNRDTSFVVSALDFFSKVAVQLDTALIAKLDINRLLLAFLDGDNVDRERAALVAVGVLASSAAGLLYLRDKPVLRRFFDYTWMTNDQELRALAFHHGGAVFAVPSEAGDQSETCVATLRALFDSMVAAGRSLVASGMDNLKLPFTPIRQGVLHLFRNLARYDFGRLAMVNHANFLEYLTNRASEVNLPESHTLLQWKLSIVETLLNAPTIREELGSVQYAALMHYRRTGVYAGGEAAAMVANASG